MGGTIRPLLSENVNITTGEFFVPMVQGRAYFNVLISKEPPVQIDLCIGAARDALTAIGNIENRYFKDTEGKFFYPDRSTPIESWFLSALSTAVRNFEAVFRAEMQKAATYRVPKSGIYDVADLVDRSQEAFPPDVREIMSSIALDEYQQAGRCYAFGLYSASGYHSCRSIEAVLRIYHKFFTGSAPSEKSTWGNILSGLERVENGPKPSEKTLGQIKHVKDFDRNPLSHLRAVLDQDDADVLFSGAKVVIFSMCKDMIREGSSVEPKLELQGGSTGLSKLRE